MPNLCNEAVTITERTCICASFRHWSGESLTCIRLIYKIDCIYPTQEFLNLDRTKLSWTTAPSSDQYSKLTDHPFLITSFTPITKAHTPSPLSRCSSKGVNATSTPSHTLSLILYLSPSATSSSSTLPQPVSCKSFIEGAHLVQNHSPFRLLIKSVRRSFTSELRLSTILLMQLSRTREGVLDLMSFRQMGHSTFLFIHSLIQ